MNGGGQQARFSFAKDYVYISPGKKSLTLVYRREVKGKEIYSERGRVSANKGRSSFSGIFGIT